MIYGFPFFWDALYFGVFSWLWSWGPGFKSHYRWYFCPSARQFIHIAVLDPGVKWGPGRMQKIPGCMWSMHLPVGPWSPARQGMLPREWKLSAVLKLYPKVIIVCNSLGWNVHFISAAIIIINFIINFSLHVSQWELATMWLGIYGLKGKSLIHNSLWYFNCLINKVVSFVYWNGLFTKWCSL